MLILLLVSIGCGDDERPPPLEINNQFDMESDGPQPDMDEADMPVDPNEGCSPIEDLGVIVSSRVLEAILAPPGQGHKASCQSPEIDSGSKIYSFTVESDVRLTVTADAIPRMVGEIVIPPSPALELREAQCGADGSDRCSTDRRQTFDLKSGTPYFW